MVDKEAKLKDAMFVVNAARTLRANATMSEGKALVLAEDAIVLTETLRIFDMHWGKEKEQMFESYTKEQLQQTTAIAIKEKFPKLMQDVNATLLAQSMKGYKSATITLNQPIELVENVLSNLRERGLEVNEVVSGKIYEVSWK